MPILGTPEKPFTLKPRCQQRGRPRKINKEKFDSNWDKIFGDKSQAKTEKSSD
mgnify:FL=1